MVYIYLMQLNTWSKYQGKFPVNARIVSKWEALSFSEREISRQQFQGVLVGIKMAAVLKINPSRQGTQVLNKNKAGIVSQPIFEKIKAAQIMTWNHLSLFLSESKVSFGITHQISMPKERWYFLGSFSPFHSLLNGIFFMLQSKIFIFVF